MKKQILFYPTNFRHVIDFKRVCNFLEGWDIRIICIESYLHRFGIRMEATIRDAGFPYVLATNPVPDHSWFNPMPDIVVFGAGYELLSLRLLTIAYELRIPTLAIEEVSQLLLNSNGLNNYTFPFDKLLVANEEEYDRFVNLGKGIRQLKITGLQCFENIPQQQILIKNRRALRHKLKIADWQRALIVVCAPLKSIFNRHSQETGIIRRKTPIAFNFDFWDGMKLSARKNAAPIIQPLVAVNNNDRIDRIKKTYRYFFGIQKLCLIKK